MGFITRNREIDDSGLTEPEIEATRQILKLIVEEEYKDFRKEIWTELPIPYRADLLKAAAEKDNPNIAGEDPSLNYFTHHVVESGVLRTAPNWARMVLMEKFMEVRLPPRRYDLRSYDRYPSEYEVESALIETSTLDIVDSVKSLHDKPDFASFVEENMISILKKTTKSEFEDLRKDPIRALETRYQYPRFLFIKVRFGKGSPETLRRKYAKEILSALQENFRLDLGFNVLYYKDDWYLIGMPFGDFQVYANIKYPLDPNDLAAAKSIFESFREIHAKWKQDVEIYRSESWKQKIPNIINKTDEMMESLTGSNWDVNDLPDVIDKMNELMESNSKIVDNFGVKVLSVAGRIDLTDFKDLKRYIRIDRKDDDDEFVSLDYFDVLRKMNTISIVLNAIEEMKESFILLKTNEAIRTIVRDTRKDDLVTKKRVSPVIQEYLDGVKSLTEADTFPEGFPVEVLEETRDLLDEIENKFSGVIYEQAGYLINVIEDKMRVARAEIVTCLNCHREIAEGAIRYAVKEEGGGFLCERCEYEVGGAYNLEYPPAPKIKKPIPQKTKEKKKTPKIKEEIDAHQEIKLLLDAINISVEKMAILQVIDGADSLLKTLLSRVEGLAVTGRSEYQINIVKKLIRPLIFAYPITPNEKQTNSQLRFLEITKKLKEIVSILNEGRPKEIEVTLDTNFRRDDQIIVTVPYTSDPSITYINMVDKEKHEFHIPDEVNHSILFLCCQLGVDLNLKYNPTSLIIYSSKNVDPSHLFFQIQRYMPLARIELVDSLRTKSMLKRGPLYARFFTDGNSKWYVSVFDVTDPRSVYSLIIACQCFDSMGKDVIEHYACFKERKYIQRMEKTPSDADPEVFGLLDMDQIDIVLTNAGLSVK